MRSIIAAGYKALSEPLQDAEEELQAEFPDDFNYASIELHGAAGPSGRPDSQCKCKIIR